MSKYVIIEKLRESDNPKHPFTIEVGYKNKGYFVDFPKVGERFNVDPISMKPGERGMSTSLVQEIIDEETFRTFNSIYKFKIIDNVNE